MTEKSVFNQGNFLISPRKAGPLYSHQNTEYMRNTYLLLFFLIVGFSHSSTYGQYSLEDRWPGLRFKFPVGMYTAPDSSNRIFVLEQAGKIVVFKDSNGITSADTTAFLNLAGKVSTGISTGTEYGLLGMAFHPKFKNNGYVYVNYTRSNPLTTYVSRFKVSSNDANKLEPTSEKVVLKVAQPYSNHNAGSIVFGDDGYLYISLGDGGSGGDPGNRAQNKTVLLGKILRVDVDVPIDDSTYQIPPDNPFVGNTQNWRKEIFTYGMRNPWKISKDPESSTIWIGEVGQNLFEEIDTIRAGANYGWRIMEGNYAYSVCSGCDTSNYEKPIYVYGRNTGNCVIGGFVYRGNEMPRMKGSYVYGDYGSGKIWMLQKDQNGAYQNTLLMSPAFSMSSFGLDNKKELYVLGYHSTGGYIKKFRCALPQPILTAPLVTTVCNGDSVILQAPTTGNPTGYLWSTGDTTNKIVIRNPGVYEVSVRTRSTLGCYSYSSNPVVVKVVTPPSKPIVPNISICENDTSLVSLSNSLSYLWSDGSTESTLAVDTSGSFWVIASDSVGCKSDTSRFNSSIIPQPGQPAITQPGSNLIRTDSIPNGTYTWFLDNAVVATTNSPSLAVNESGIFSVMVTTQEGCRSDTSTPFQVTVLVSAAKEVAEAFSVSPNPFRDNFIVLAGRSVTSSSVGELLTADGKRVLTFQLAKGSRATEIKTDGLPKGSYILKISCDKADKVFRLVKE